MLVVSRHPLAVAFLGLDPLFFSFYVFVPRLDLYGKTFSPWLKLSESKTMKSCFYSDPVSQVVTSFTSL